MMKILVLNGANLNLLGKREEDHYGGLSLLEIEEKTKEEFPDDDFVFFQSNHEGELIEKIHNAEKEFDGIIINPGGFSHTSVSIRDALEISKLPKIEVHLSNLANREAFRNTSITAARCNGYISGFKEMSYFAAVFLIKKIKMDDIK